MKKIKGMKMSPIPTFLIAAVLAAIVSAHGLVFQTPGFKYITDVFSHVHYHVMNTKTYTGFLPTATPDFTLSAPSIVRRIGSDGPVQNLACDEMACNSHSTPL